MSDFTNDPAIPPDGPGEPASPEPTEPPAAVWEDFVDILFSPTAVFERRRGWSAWPVLLVLTAMLVVLFIGWQRALGPILDLEMQRGMAEAMAQNPDLGPEQMEQARSMGRIFGPVGLALAFPFGIVLTTLVAWGLTRLFGTAATFATIMGVAVYSQVVRILQYVFGLVQSLFLNVQAMDSIHDVSLSAARFMDQPEASVVMVNLAARVDVFTLWATALIAIGLRVTTGLSKGAAWGVALIVWVLASLPALLGALAGGG